MCQEAMLCTLQGLMTCHRTQSIHTQLKNLGKKPSSILRDVVSLYSKQGSRNQVTAGIIQEKVGRQ